MRGWPDLRVAFVQRIRAQAALAAYQTALDYVERLPHAQIVLKLTEKIVQKQRDLDLADKLAKKAGKDAKLP